MSEWPEALVEKIAHGLYTGILYGGTDWEWDQIPPKEMGTTKRLLRCAAQDALDALGLVATEEFGIDYGDGEVDGGWADVDGPRRAAERDLRQAIPEQRTLYEYTLVRRVVMSGGTDWEDV